MAGMAMTIRRLFSMFTLSIVLVMSTVGVWQFLDAQKKVEAVVWLEKSNDLVSGVHRTSTEMAVERGLTTSLLAQLNAGAEQDNKWSSINIQQKLVDSHLQNVIHRLDQLIAIQPSKALLKYQQQLYAQLDVLSRQRQQVEQLVNGEEADLTASGWFDSVTENIEMLHSIASVSMLPIEGNIYSYASHPVVQDVLFTLSEYLGRQRALVATLLADKEPLAPATIKTIERYQSISDESYQRFLIFIEHLPDSEQLRPEVAHLQEQMQTFKTLKQRIIAQNKAGQAYSVNADEWFAQATTTIQSVQENSYKLSTHHDRKVSQLGRHAQQAQWFAVMLFVFLVVGFSVAGRMLRKRILTPLSQLRAAAERISQGHLEQPFQHESEDEVGQLGRAFERMRLQLLADQRLRAKHEQELNKLYTAIEQSIVAIIITDQQGKVEYVNQPYLQTTGYQANELLGHPFDILRSEAKSIGHYQALKSNLSSGTSWTGELLNKRKDGSLYWAFASISPVFNAVGEISHYIDIHLDISESKRVAQRLNFVSYYDQTTSLPNRQYLSRHFEQLKQDARIDQPIALVSLTIGKLKQVNDSLGWRIGDQLLRAVGGRLKQQVSTDDLVAHQEGGKFIVLIVTANDQAELSQQADKLVACLSQPFVLDQHTVQLNPKVGVSIYDRTDCQSFECFLNQSNIALHYSEASSVNSVSFYQSDMDETAKHRMQLEGALASATQNNELELYYQPKVDMKTAEVVSVEALLRWFDTDSQTYISPAEFIPIAERNGLIFTLGDWVLEQACLQLLQWQQEQQLLLTVAVNLSVEQLKQPNFLDNTKAILTKTGVSPERIELELTEGVLMEHPEEAMDLLIQLKGMGFKLSIDDFGTGYSSLSYLSRLPVDYLKIDRSFIERITTDISAASIATSIIDLGHRMGLKVVAEGVENAAQLEYLNQNNCDYLQGFYYSRALPADQLIELLTTERRHNRAFGNAMSDPS